MHETSHAPVTIDSSQRVPLRVVELGNRGRGVVADRDIAEGDLIERAPVILVPREDRAAIDASNVGNYIFVWEHDSVAEDIYKPDVRAAVVLGFASLVNHSPDPNCDFVRHIEALALDVFALRDIKAGEELTFDYGMALWFTPD